MGVFATIAMYLDTLPGEGRVLLLSLLLACALYVFAKVLPGELGSNLQLLYRKGALLALLLVPMVVYLLGVQVPVFVDEVVPLVTPVPGYVAYALLALWVIGALYHMIRLVKDLGATYSASNSANPAHSKIQARADHWQRRLNLKRAVRVVCNGAEHGWHVGDQWQQGQRTAVIVLPAAALNWPAGVVDALLLTQLAQLQQGSWRWLVFGRVVQALYWPTPWIALFVQKLATHLEVPGIRLARAAYRDPEGWQRDLRNLEKRASTLSQIPLPQVGALVRLANSGQATEVARRPSTSQVITDEVTFEDKWGRTQRRKRDKERDPYEQAYWLIAVASIVVGVASTLTLVQAPPEFEREYFRMEWKDQMVRRVRDFYRGDDSTSAEVAPFRSQEADEES